MKSLKTEIFGKTDKWSVSLKIWADHENTDLCVVHHLLIYLYCAGIKAGSLFPSEQELNNPPDDASSKPLFIMAHSCAN